VRGHQVSLLGHLLVFSLIGGCSPTPQSVPLATRLAAQHAITNEVEAAYDLRQPNVVDRLMALYAPTGPIVSASGGRLITNRDSLRMGIQAFWDNVGKNMRSPHVEWVQMDIDVVAPNAAVMTAVYRIPHKQPNGLPHVIGGAWTAVFVFRDGKWVIVQEHLSDNPYAS